MSTFTYKGTTSDGTAVEETVEGTDRYFVYDKARESGHTIMSISEQSEHASLGKWLHLDALNALLSHVKQDAVVMLSRNLGAMLRAGLPLTRALSVAERQTKHAGLKKVLMGVR